jgi:hypothetical protein
MLRYGVAVLAGLLAATAANIGYGPGTASDWDQLWLAGRALLAGQDPYAAIVPGVNSPWPLIYPLPAVILSLPFALVPLGWARRLWVGINIAVLAYALSDRPRWRAVALVSGPVVWSVIGAQWTPLLVASVWLPWLAVLFVAKPTTGAVLWVRRPSWLAVIAAAAIGGVSFLLVPGWIGSWRAAVAGQHHVPLLWRPGGVLLLAALFRWRRPEARLLASLALVPSAALPYDLLVLYAVAETRREWWVLTVLTSAVGLWASVVSLSADMPSKAAYLAQNAWPAMLLLGYLPAVAMVLRRPNVASTPWARSAPALTSIAVDRAP